MTSRRSTHEHAADIDHYGADDAAPFPGATWHYSDTATWPKHITPAPTVERLTPQRWIVTRTRPGDSAPSFSGGFTAGSPNLALIRYLERHGQQPLGTRVDIRRPGHENRREIVASYVRGKHIWESQWNETTPRRRVVQPTETLSPGELRPGMLALESGMICLVRDEPTKSASHADRNGGCYWTKALVINRDGVSSDRVPHSFTRPRKSNGYADDAAIARGEHHWTFQGNDLAHVAVLVHGPLERNA